MRIQRYMYAALLAVLIWIVILKYDNDRIVDFMLWDFRIAIYLIAGIFGATLAGIWIIDAVLPWSWGTISLADIRSNAARIGASIAASTIFAVPYAVLVRSLSGEYFSFADAFARTALSVIPAVLFAIIIVDVIFRHYKR